MRRVATITLITGFLLALAPITVFAESQPALGTSVRVPDNLKDYYYAGLAPERLAYSLDLWYDAVLKGDRSDTRNCETTLSLLLQRDLDSSFTMLQAYQQICDQMVAESGPANAETAAKDSMNFLAQSWQVYQAKQRLIESIKSTEAVSFKYRLLGDYIDLLRRELGMERPKLASLDHPAAVPTAHGSPRKENQEQPK